MSRILFHIDERDFLSGKVDAPFLTIQETAGPKRLCEAHGNKAGLELLKSSEHGSRVNALRAANNDLAAIADNAAFASRIIALTVAPNENQADISTLQSFANLTYLNWSGPSPSGSLGDAFPSLTFLTIGKLKKTTLTGLTHLAGLNLLSGAKFLEECESPHLIKMFITGYDADSLMGFDKNTELETLRIHSRKKGLDFGFLKSYKNLKNFSFEGPAEQKWETISKGLEKVSIEKTPNSIAVLKHLSNTPIVSIGYNPKLLDDEGAYRGDLLAAGDPFRSLFGNVHADEL